MGALCALELSIVRVRILRRMKKEGALLTWFAAGFASVPITVVLHELGHYSAGRFLGWRDLALHYSSVRLASGGPVVASAIHAPWKVAFFYVAGPIVSLAILFVAALLVGRPGPLAVSAACGLSSAVRFLWPLSMGTMFLVPGIERNYPNLDEFNFAVNIGIPPLLSMFSSSFAAAVGLFWMARRLWHRELALPLVALAVGVAAGFAFYLWFLGPHLLP